MNNTTSIDPMRQFFLRVILPLLVVFFLLSVVSNAHGQTVSVTTKTKSVYLGANGAIFQDGPVQQTFVDFNWKSGVYAEVWTSTSFNRQWNFGKEADGQLGYAGKVGAFDYSIDANYFAIVITDVVNFNAEVSKSLKLGSPANVTPFVRIESYFPVAKGGPRKGVMGVVGTRVSANLTSRISANFMARFKKDSGCFAFDSALLGQGFVGMSFKLSDKFSVNAGVTISTPLSHVNDGRKTLAAWETGLSYQFR